MGWEGLLLTSAGRELEISHGLETCWVIAWSVSSITIESLAYYNYLSSAVLQEVRLLSCNIWKEGLRTVSIYCLALTGRHSQLLGCMMVSLRLLILLTFFFYTAKQQPKALLNHRSASAYLCESCVAEGHLLTVNGMLINLRLFNL